MMVSELSFLLGSCRLFTSFAMDLTTNLNVLSIGRKFTRNSSQVKQQLCETIKLFSDVHELSVEIPPSRPDIFYDQFKAELSFCDLF